MTQANAGKDCALNMWAVAAIAGLVLVIVMLSVGRSFMASLFTGVIAAGLFGVILTWLFCRPEERARAATAHTDDPQDVVTQATAPVAAPEAAPATAPEPPAPAPTPEPSAATEPSPEPAPAAPSAPDPAPAPAPAHTVGASDVVTPSKPLAGEAELAGRKGSWSYQPDATAPTAKPEPAPVQAGGTRPAALQGARDGTPDDLKKIKGVGPKLETLLNTLGFYHFDQIAAWTADEVAWVDQNLTGFKGRVSRDGWVDQAATLAQGGATAFSQKVDKGDVY